MDMINRKKLSITDGGIVFLITVTLLLSVNLFFGVFVPRETFSTGSYFYLVGAAELLAVGIPPLIFVLVKKISLRNIFKKKLSVEQAVLCAFIAVFTYPVLGFIRLLWMILLESINIPFLSQAMPAINTLPIFLVATIAISIFPGFFEEIVFRGIIQNSFQMKYRARKSILLTALFFMLMHADVYSWTFTFAAGIVLGLIYYLTESLWASIIFHAVNNFIGVAVGYIYSLIGYDELLRGDVDLFSASMNLWFSVIVLLVTSIVCAGIVVLLFWALKVVTKKPEEIVYNKNKLGFTSYVSYIVGGLLMVVVTVLPVVVSMIIR